MLEEKIEQLISASLNGLGYAIVRVKLMKPNNRQTLQIMIERIDSAPITIDDCEAASNLVSAILDVEDPIPDEYYLEMSSPGIERPLVKIADYQRFTGHKAKLSLHNIVSGTKKHSGVIKSVNGNNIEMLSDSDQGVLLIEFSNIKTANLVYTSDK
jgi:ribosome maturation factor RimP